MSLSRNYAVEDLYQVRKLHDKFQNISGVPFAYFFMFKSKRFFAADIQDGGRKTCATRQN